MSFGFSIGDFVAITRIALTAVNNTRQACGAHDEFTREVVNLHLVLCHLEAEKRRPASILNQRHDNRVEELALLLADCRRQLRVVNQILDKYNALSKGDRSLAIFVQRVRFGNGELPDLNRIRTQLCTHAQWITMFLTILSTASLSALEQLIKAQGGEAREMISALMLKLAELQGSKRNEGSVLSTHGDDDKAIWKLLRRELNSQGFPDRLLRQHKDRITQFILELGARGGLDDLPDIESEIETLDYSTKEEDSSLLDNMNAQNSKEMSAGGLLQFNQSDTSKCSPTATAQHNKSQEKCGISISAHRILSLNIDGPAERHEFKTLLSKALVRSYQPVAVVDEIYESLLPGAHPNYTHEAKLQSPGLLNVTSGTGGQAYSGPGPCITTDDFVSPLLTKAPELDFDEADAPRRLKKAVQSKGSRLKNEAAYISTLAEGQSGRLSPGGLYRRISQGFATPANSRRPLSASEQDSRLRVSTVSGPEYPTGSDRLPTSDKWSDIRAPAQQQPLSNSTTLSWQSNQSNQAQGQPRTTHPLQPRVIATLQYLNQSSQVQGKSILSGSLPNPSLSFSSSRISDQSYQVQGQPRTTHPLQPRVIASLQYFNQSSQVLGKSIPSGSLPNPSLSFVNSWIPGSAISRSNTFSAEACSSNSNSTHPAG